MPDIQTEHQTAVQMIEEAIAEHWGERCPDFEPECFLCQVWAKLDALTEAEHQRDVLAGHFHRMMPDDQNIEAFVEDITRQYPTVIAFLHESEKREQANG